MEQLVLPGTVRPVMIGVGGCSGSGKTTLAKELASELNATLFPLDFYYRDLGHLTPAERYRVNYDHPDSLESELLVSHVEQLSRGESIERPIYDFSAHTRVPHLTDCIAPTEFVIVEGILALHYPELLPFYTLRVYVDAPHEVCLNRRIYRDVRERGRTEESVREQFHATARPMAEQFVLPSRELADVCVDGCEALDWSIESVLGTLRQMGCCPGTRLQLSYSLRKCLAIAVR